MAIVRFISRSHRLNIDFEMKNLKEFVSETTRPWYVALPSESLPSLFKLSPWGKKLPLPGGQMFNIGLYRENMKKEKNLLV